MPSGSDIPGDRKDADGGGDPRGAQCAEGASGVEDGSGDHDPADRGQQGVQVCEKDRDGDGGCRDQSSRSRASVRGRYNDRDPEGGADGGRGGRGGSVLLLRNE